jgi:hypothetical protein
MNAGFNSFEDLFNLAKDAEDLTNLEAKVQQNTDDIDDNKTNIATNTTNITQLNIDMLANRTQIINNEGLILNNESDITTLNNNVLFKDGSILLDNTYTPSNNYGLVNKLYVDNHTQGNYLRIDGSNSMTGDLNLDSNDLININELVFPTATIRELNNTIDFRFGVVDVLSLNTSNITIYTDLDINNNQITNAGVISTNNLNATGDIYCANLDATNDIKALGDIDGVDITASGNLSCVDITASGNLSCVDITASGNIDGVDINASGNVEILGNINLEANQIMDYGYNASGRANTTEGKITYSTITSQYTLNIYGGLDATAEGQGNNKLIQLWGDVYNGGMNTFHINSGSGGNGDCNLIIEADDDNTNENSTPQIIFKADGITEGAIYLNNNSFDIVSSIDINGGIRFLTTTTNSDYTNGNLAMTISNTNQNVDVYETLNLREYINNNSNSKLQLASSEATKHQTDTGCLSYRSNNTFGHSLDIFGGRDTTQATTERKIVLHDDVNVEGYITISGSAGDMGGTTHRGCRQIILNNTLNSSAGWSVGNQIDTSPSTSDNDLYFEVRYTNGSYNIAGFVQDSVNKAQMNFTGQHRCATNDLKLNSQLIGLIVESTGKYRNMIDYDEQLICNKNSITISESLPLVQLCNEEKSKRVFGVLSDKEDSKRSFGNNFQSLYTLKEGDERYFINSLGEGAIWIHNNNGNIENGDYICSYINGYGQKQDDDLLHNYTVAKSTMNCDFNPQLEVVKLYDGVDENKNIKFKDALDNEGNIIYEPEYECITLDDGSKIAFIGCTYHCG